MARSKKKELKKRAHKKKEKKTKAKKRPAIGWNQWVLLQASTDRWCIVGQVHVQLHEWKRCAVATGASICGGASIRAALVAQAAVDVLWEKI
jgi:hypothetical protein